MRGLQKKCRGKIPVYHTTHASVRTRRMWFVCVRNCSIHEICSIASVCVLGSSPRGSEERRTWHLMIFMIMFLSVIKKIISLMIMPWSWFLKKNLTHVPGLPFIALRSVVLRHPLEFIDDALLFVLHPPISLHVHVSVCMPNYAYVCIDVCMYVESLQTVAVYARACTIVRNHAHSLLIAGFACVWHGVYMRLNPGWIPAGV